MSFSPLGNFIQLILHQSGTGHWAIRRRDRCLSFRSRVQGRETTGALQWVAFPFKDIIRERGRSQGRFLERASPWSMTGQTRWIRALERQKSMKSLVLCVQEESYARTGAGAERPGVAQKALIGRVGLSCIQKPNMQIAP